MKDRRGDEVVNGDDVFNWMDSIPLKQAMVNTQVRTGSNYVQPKLHVRRHGSCGFVFNMEGGSIVSESIYWRY